MNEDIIRIMQVVQCDRLHAERLMEYRNRREGISLTEVALAVAMAVVFISIVALAVGLSLDIVALWLLPALAMIGLIAGSTIE